MASGPVPEKPVHVTVAFVGNVRATMAICRRCDDVKVIAAAAKPATLCRVAAEAELVRAVVTGNAGSSVVGVANATSSGAVLSALVEVAELAGVAKSDVSAVVVSAGEEADPPTLPAVGSDELTDGDGALPTLDGGSLTVGAGSGGGVGAVSAGGSAMTVGWGAPGGSVTAGGSEGVAWGSGGGVESAGGGEVAVSGSGVTVWESVGEVEPSLDGTPLDVGDSLPDVLVSGALPLDAVDVSVVVVDVSETEAAGGSGGTLGGGVTADARPNPAGKP